MQNILLQYKLGGARLLLYFLVAKPAGHLFYTLYVIYIPFRTAGTTADEKKL